MINDLIIRSILSINMKVMTSSYHKKKKKTKSNRTIPSLTEADVYSMSYYIKLYKEGICNEQMHVHTCGCRQNILNFE